MLRFWRLYSTPATRQTPLPGAKKAYNPSALRLSLGLGNTTKTTPSKTPAPAQSTTPRSPLTPTSKASASAPKVTNPTTISPPVAAPPPKPPALKKPKPALPPVRPVVPPPKPQVENKFDVAPPRPLAIPELIKARELSRLMNVRLVDLTRSASEALGLEITNPDEDLDQDVASLLAMEFNYLPETANSSSKLEVKENFIARRPAPTEQESKDWPLRTPIVTIIGHVDHGKTTLLDSFRKTNVVAGEAGGITQHIGAFSVVLPSKRKITFIDTPGHAAFTSMRARGANVTDIVVLVVSAEDGVMPQTIEAIRHAKAADVPIIVAINKCDKPGANPSRVTRELLEHGVEAEEFGGPVQCVKVSALRGTGLDELEEAIAIQAELMNLKADLSGPCEATVIESRMSKHTGGAATVLVERGTLRPGSVIVFGNGKCYCRVRQIMDDKGQVLKEAVPSTPCEIQGKWSSLPEAGDEAIQADGEDVAKSIVTKYHDTIRHQKSIRDTAASGRNKMIAKATLEVKERLYEAKRSKLAQASGNRSLYVRIAKEMESLEAVIKKLRLTQTETTKQYVTKELKVIVKGDVHGSVEAVSKCLMDLNESFRKKLEARELEAGESAEIPRERIHIDLLSSGVGAFTPSDVELLAAAKKATRSKNDSQCLMVGFNLSPPSKQISELLKSYEIPTIANNVIYRLLEDVRKSAVGLLTPEYKYETLGEAEVLQVFKINGGREIIAGCRVSDGTLFRSQEAAANAAKKTASDALQDSQSGTIHFRVQRAGVEVHKGELKTMKHFKNDVNQISKGSECGLGFGDFKDVQEGDVISCVKKVKVETIL